MAGGAGETKVFVGKKKDKGRASQRWHKNYKPYSSAKNEKAAQIKILIWRFCQISECVTPASLSFIYAASVGQLAHPNLQPDEDRMRSDVSVSSSQGRGRSLDLQPSVVEAAAAAAAGCAAQEGS